MNCLPTTPASRRYTQRFIPVMAAYVITLFFAAWYIPRFHPTGGLVYVIAVLPAIPIIGVIAVIGLYLAEEKDEFQRSVLIQSMLWGMGLTLATTTVWGFLENFAKTVGFQPYLTFPLFCFFFGVITPFIKRRYR